MDNIVHDPLLPEEQERLKKLQEELEGQGLVALIERLQKQLELSVNQVAIAAGMDESALHKILKGENREFKAEHVDRLLDDLQRRGKLMDANEATIWKRALRIAAYLYFDLYKTIEPRLRRIEDPVKRVEYLKEHLSKQYPALAETYDKTGGAFPAFLPLLDAVAREWNKRWGWIRVPSGYRLNVVKGNQYTISSTDLFPKKVSNLGDELILEDTGFGTFTVKKRASIQKSFPPKSRNTLDKDVLVLGGMEFVRVRAGKFLMGDEMFTVDIPYDYWMARYPVTNMQYSAYAIAKVTKDSISNLLQKNDHPVVRVSWQNAMAYCQWLNSLFKAELPSGLGLRLPTEAEWEKAARGTDGLEYPWGNTFDKNKCNTSEGGKGDTTPVGLYSPQGDSPYGCADMSGNVWEWTHSLMKPYPYNVKDGREDEKASGFRVLRGGSFDNSARYARCACRSDDVVVNISDGIGFRVVVASPNLS